MKEVNAGSVVKYAVSLVLTLATIYVVVRVAGAAWKKSHESKAFN